MSLFILILKGVYEDYTKGVYSAIAKTILVKSLIIHIFTRVENQPLKQRFEAFFKTY